MHATVSALFSAVTLCRQQATPLVALWSAAGGEPVDDVGNDFLLALLLDEDVPRARQQHQLLVLRLLGHIQGSSSMSIFNWRGSRRLSGAT